MAKVYINNGATRTAIAGLIAGKVRDAVDTENTISLTLFGDDALSITDTSIIEFDGQYYDVVEFQLYRSGYIPIAEVFAESVIFRLNDYNISGNVGDITKRVMSQVVNLAISGTPFSFGSTDLLDAGGYSAYAAFPVGTLHTRRWALQYISTNLKNSSGVLVPCDIEIDGYTINVWAHRGATTPVELFGTKNTTSLKVSRNVADNRTSYEIGLNKKLTLAAGDDVHIVFSPLNVDVNTRIMAIEYHPYNPYEVSIEVGDYEPDIKDLFVTG